MTSLIPSMRLKVKRDTFFLPDSNNGLYFRNNLNSFQMKGNMIEQWVEMLMPMFNGEYTLGELTNGLPDPHRKRVYEIAEVLYQNGFIRDVSQDHPHQLKDWILKKYASQIEFLDNFSDSGAYRFQCYRQTEVLAVGSGPFFVSLVSALLESGLPKCHMLITDSLPTNRSRLLELTAHAHKTDPQVATKEITFQKAGVSSWRKVIQPFQWILYVSQEGNVEELRALQRACKEEKKGLIPAVCFQQNGIAGPVAHPSSEGCWESAWRHIHQSVFSKEEQQSSFSPTAGAMLANMIIFELFKKVTGVTELEEENQFFLLDLDTLEGNWQTFIPHPLVTGRTSIKWIQDFHTHFEENFSNDNLGELLRYFNQLTSEESGIFHIWEEGELVQLPLAQCRVQPVDPLSAGPAELLPEIICADLTHEGARKEAGLIGIEAYVSRLVDGSLEEFVGVGAGETFGESVCRGLQRCLVEELTKQDKHVSQVQLGKVEDKHCQFYLQALIAMEEAPTIGLGKEVFGFPVVWVGTSDGWYSSVDLHITLALRKALQQALMKKQNQNRLEQGDKNTSIILEEGVLQNLTIPSCEELVQSELLQSAMETLEQNDKKISVFELEWESLLKEELIGVFGVVFREEESQ